MLTLESRLRVSPGVVATSVGDEVAMLHLESGRYYGLSPTAAPLWPQLNEPVRVGQLLAGMLDTYAVDEAVARRDLLALLDELLQARLVEELPADQPVAP